MAGRIRVLACMTGSENRRCQLLPLTRIILPTLPWDSICLSTSDKDLVCLLIVVILVSLILGEQEKKISGCSIPCLHFLQPKLMSSIIIVDLLSHCIFDDIMLKALNKACTLALVIKSQTNKYC